MIGTSVRNSRSRLSRSVLGRSEGIGTTRATLMSLAVLGISMSSKGDQAGGVVVYRTVQKSPGLMGRTVGPLFSTKDEAKAVAEEFAENGLNAAPTRWEAADGDRGTIEMVPEATRHTLAVEPVTVHESADEVTPKQPRDTNR